VTGATAEKVGPAPLPVPAVPAGCYWVLMGPTGRLDPRPQDTHEHGNHVLIAHNLGHSGHQRVVLTSVSATPQGLAENLLARRRNGGLGRPRWRTVMTMTSSGDNQVPLELAESIASAIDARKVDLASQIAEDILSQTPIEVRQEIISDALQAAKDQAEKLHACAMRLGNNVAYRLG
jgi:hypothetical protein